MEKFEPKIIGLFCNWCSYQDADLAGTSQLKYAPNVRMIRLMCSGRVDPTFVLKAFQNGADGVLIHGCHLGDCHYQDGNRKTVRRISLLKKMLTQLGIEEKRVRLELAPTLETTRLASTLNEMTEEVRKLGPFSNNGGRGG